MSHAVIVRAARMFAASGFPVFRFDFSGCGDSEGDLRFSSIANWQQELDAAITLFRKETGVEKCVLWGLRLGAGLALLLQQRNSNVPGLILWQPVLDFSVHIKQFLRQKISNQISKGYRNAGRSPEDELRSNGLVHVNGYPVTTDFYNSCTEIASKPAEVVPSVPVFILSVSLLKQPSFALKKYEERLQKAGTQVEMKHVTAEPFWDRYWQWEREKTAITTLQWLHGLGKG